MGFSDGNILLEHDNRVYYAGETVRGKVVFDLEKVTKCRGIYLTVFGCCKVHWTTTTAHRHRLNRKTSHDAYEEYLNLKVNLVGESQGNETELSSDTSFKTYSLCPGHYEYPFTCPLPSSLPSSFNGSAGRIAYEIKTAMVGKFKLDKKLCVSLIIKGLCDLNAIQGAKEPLQLEINNSYCCWCLNYGSSEVLVKIPTSGFCVGQKIPIEVSCMNNSRAVIDRIGFMVTRKIKYIATSEPDTREDPSKVIAVLGRGPVPAYTTKNWIMEMEAPPVGASGLIFVEACRYIKIRYTLEVYITASGCHAGGSESHRIYFGTTPVFMPNVISPIENMQNVAATNSLYVRYTCSPPPYSDSPPYPCNANTSCPGYTNSPQVLTSSLDNPSSSHP